MIRRKLFAGVSLLAALALSLPAVAGTKYVYDSAGRLVQVEYSSGVTIRYSYDPAGNRREITTTQLPNRAPVATNDSTSVITSRVIDIQVRANDSDPDRNPITITSVSAVSGGGSAVIMGGGTYIRFTAPGATGVKTFTYTLSDGKGGTASATVTVVVDAAPNVPPVAVNDSATALTSGVIDIHVRANDSDPDGDPLTISGVSSVSGGGTATIAGGGSHIQFTAPASTGVKSFTYTITDGRGGTATASVNVTVNAPPNQSPVANNDSASLTVGTSTSIMVLANDSDPDGDAIFVSGVGAPTGGSASVAPGGGYVIYNAPATAGTYNFVYSINDGRGGTSVATIYVTVTPPPNRSPVANNDVATTGPSNSTTISVLSNDSDPDGDTLTITGVSAVTGGGTATIYGTSIHFAAPAAPGTKTFTYNISDGRGGTASATVTVNVSAANRPPVAVNDVKTMNKGTSSSIVVLANDSDPDNDRLTIISITAPSLGTASIAPGGTHISYVAPNWTDVDTFNYTISDGRGGTATAQVRITTTTPGGGPKD